MDPQETDRKWRLSRRRMLLLMGAAGATALAVSSIPGLLKLSARTAEGATRKGSLGSPPGAARTRQWAMVFDLRKCEGCVTKDTPPKCVEGCNATHFVPPRQEWLVVYEMEGPGGHKYFMPRPCMQCENAPCVKVCPVGATYRTAEGIVLIDHERCIGCRMCIAACPYGARRFNWDQPPNPPAATFASYTPEFPVPHRKGVAEKCMLCAHNVKDGKLPACASACPMLAIYLGDLTEDVATNGKEVVKLSRFLADNSAYRLKEDLGTRPRVWYIPGHGQESGHGLDDGGAMQRPRSWVTQAADDADRATHAHGGAQ